MNLRTCLQLGRAAGLVRGCWFCELECLLASLCRRRLLDACLRQYLRAPGKYLRLSYTHTPLTFLLKSMQDKTDDIHVGIHSTALLFGSQTRPILSALSVSSLSLISLAGYLNAQGLPFYLGTTLAAAQLARVLYNTDFDSRPSCWKGFVGCGWAGFWIWMGALTDYIVMLA